MMEVLIGPRPYLSVHLSFRPEVFLGLTHYFFMKLSMVLENHVVLCVTAKCLKKIYSFFEFIGKFSH